MGRDSCLLASIKGAELFGLQLALFREHGDYGV